LREAAKRRIDPAEGMYREMEIFYKKTKRTEGKREIIEVQEGTGD
jgi:hypothetical protein